MGVPKRKMSRSRRDSRSANKGIRPQAITACLTCQAPTKPHQVCTSCGYYKGAKVLRTKTDRMHERGKVRQTRQGVAPVAAQASESQSEQI